MFSRSFARSALGLCLTALALAGTVAAPSVAHAKSAAASAKQPIAVGAINGPHGSQIRGRVMKVLRDSGSYEVTDAADAKPGASSDAYKKLASGVGAEAVVVGNVSTSMNLTLTVYGANGSKIDSIQIKGGSTQKLQKAVDNELEIAAADPLERAHKGGGGGAAAAAGAGAASASASDDDEGSSSASGDSDDAKSADEASSDSASSSDAASSADAAGESTKGVRPFEFSVGIRGYHRDFKYTGSPMTAGLYPYNITAPTILAEAKLYPGAFFTNATFSNLGITGRYEYGIATTTAFKDPTSGSTTTLKTHVYEYRFGLRGRIPLGRHEFGIFGEYGSQSFALVGDENPSKQPYAVVPDVHYNYLRFGLDARFRISKFMVGANVAPRFLTSMKELDKGGVWFPGATGSGLDFGMMLGWQLLPWLAPTIGVDYVRYGFDFNNLPAKPPPRVIAGGATDTYLSGWFALLFTLGGDGGVATAAVEASSDTSAASNASTESEKPAAKSEASDKADEEEDEAPPPNASGKAKPAASQPVEEEEEE